MSVNPIAFHPKNTGIIVTAEGKSMLDNTTVNTASLPLQRILENPKAHREAESIAPIVLMAVIHKEFRRYLPNGKTEKAS